METVVGVFTTYRHAAEVRECIKSEGLNRLTLLSPGEPQHAISQEVPVADMESPGIGAAIGGVVGGALGIAGGVQLGAAAASLLIPGVGHVTAIGLLTAAALGSRGLAGGVAAGRALETSLDGGLPKDELFLYEDALRQGRSVLIVWAESREQANRAREIMRLAGAEGLDAARERWWLGLRPAEEEHYRSKGHDFIQDEDHYRRGFEAALHTDFRDQPYERVIEQLRGRYGQECDDTAFRTGYARGLEYRRNR